MERVEALDRVRAIRVALTAAAPVRFFRPPYVGGRGWFGVRLDGDVDRAEIAELREDTYRMIAPTRLVQQLDDTPDRAG